MKCRIVVGGVLLALLVAGCGGGGNSAGSNGGSSRLSPSSYRAKLAVISREADRAQSQVEQGLHAKTVAKLRARLLAFAAASARLGDEVAKLKPPTNAEAANAELARGEHDTARATRMAAAAVAKRKTPQAAVAYLQQALGNAKGAHELDAALTKLKKLGYTKGS